MTTENILLEKSDLTPYICFNAAERRMVLKGRCIPEDAHSFFIPLIKWVGELFDNKAVDVNNEYTIEINCDYYNSASAKMLVYFFDKVSEIQKEGHLLMVNWHCSVDDPELIESVNDYMAITDVNIKVMHEYPGAGNAGGGVI